MNLRNWIILIVSVALLVFLACSNQDDPYPDEPASAGGITDSAGEVELDFGSHVITVSVVDFIPQPIATISVTGHLLKDYLYIFAAGNDEFYSNFKVISYKDLDDNGDIVFAPKTNSTQSAATFTTDVSISLERITRDVYSYSEDPANTEKIPVDSWITATEDQGTLSDIFDLAGTIAKDNTIFVHVNSTVATATNAEVRTISVILDSVSVPSDTVFAVLIGLEFHIFSADTLTYSYVEYGDSILPIIFINDATLAEGAFFAQFTLTWGEVPYDLDSHLWTPAIGASSYHIYWVDRGTILEEPYAFLDVDDVTSWGPEHIVIQNESPGTYYYSVHQFSDEGNIPNSGAKVSLLKPDRTVEEFTPPNVVGSGQDWYWHVCTIDGTTGEVTEIGTMNQDPPFVTGSPSPMPEKNY
jgi:hypothetical protein